MITQVGRGLRTAVPLPLLICGLLVTLYVGLQVAFIPHVPHNDSYRYAVAIERILGHTQAQAEHKALQWYCAGTGHYPAHQVHSCITWYTAHGGLGPLPARYQQIFNARPGYPLLAAPLVAMLGLGKGLTLFSAIAVVVAGWLALLIARACGLSQPAALAALIAFYLVPSFFWLEQDLTEAPTLVFTFVVLLGMVLALRGRLAWGLTIATIGNIAGFIVRYSTFSVEAAGLAGCVLLLALCDKRFRNKPSFLIVAYNALGFLVMSVLPSLFGWPGLKDSLQDTFSDHFAEPVPHGLLDKWYKLADSYVHQIITLYTHDLATPILFVLGLAVLWYRYRVLAAIVTATALTAIGSALAHPVFSQGSRLYFQVFLVAAFGIAAAVDWLFRHYRPAITARIPGQRAGAGVGEAAGGSGGSGSDSDSDSGEGAAVGVPDNSALA